MFFLNKWKCWTRSKKDDLLCIAIFIRKKSVLLFITNKALNLGCTGISHSRVQGSVNIIYKAAYRCLSLYSINRSTWCIVVQYISLYSLYLIVINRYTVYMIIQSVPYTSCSKFRYQLRPIDKPTYTVYIFSVSFPVLMTNVKLFFINTIIFSLVMRN